jgi:hypothetical protein
MRRLLASTILAILPLIARGEEYFCTVGMATGFKYIDGAWQSANFKPKGKFVVRHPTERDIAGGKWVVNEVGFESALIGCGEDFDADGSLTCHGPEEFRMNRNLLRFVYIYPYGYWNHGSENGGDTPYVAIGECSPM